MFNPQALSSFFFCSIGVLACYILQAHLQLPSFVSSALVGLAGSFIPESKRYDSNQLIAAVYCGSFAGMCSLEYFSSWFGVLLLSCLAGLSFVSLKTFFRGFGGKLGSVAFVASLLFVLVLECL